MSSKTTWQPRSIYLYLVCLITLVMVVFSTVNLVRALAELAYPEPAPVVSTVVRVPPPPGQTAEIEEVDPEKQREVQRQWALRRSVLNVVGSLAMLLLAGPLYVYHWRRARGNSGSDTASQVTG